jgi:hypothetical protein
MDFVNEYFTKYESPDRLFSDEEIKKCIDPDLPPDCIGFNGKVYKMNFSSGPEFTVEVIEMDEDVKQVPSDLVVKATAKLQTDIDRELSVPDPEPGALARMYDKSDKKGKKKKKDK